MKAILRIILLVTFVSVLFACVKQAIEVKQTVSNGSLIQTVNGKNLTCTVSQTTLNPGQEIVLICTNETDYNATISVTINGEQVGTINCFPAEFRHKVDNAGVYQFSISGKLTSKNSLYKSETSFSHSWRVTVSN